VAATLITFASVAAVAVPASAADLHPLAGQSPSATSPMTFTKPGQYAVTMPAGSGPYTVTYVVRGAGAAAGGYAPSAIKSGYAFGGGGGAGGTAVCTGTVAAGARLTVIVGGGGATGFYISRSTTNGVGGAGGTGGTGGLGAGKTGTPGTNVSYEGPGGGGGGMSAVFSGAHATAASELAEGAGGGGGGGGTGDGGPGQEHGRAGGNGGGMVRGGKGGGPAPHAGDTGGRSGKGGAGTCHGIHGATATGGSGTPGQPQSSINDPQDSKGGVAVAPSGPAQGLTATQGAGGWGNGDIEGFETGLGGDGFVAIAWQTTA
jgi:hypothetical protein